MLLMVGGPCSRERTTKWASYAFKFKISKKRTLPSDHAAAVLPSASKIHSAQCRHFRLMLTCILLRLLRTRALEPLYLFMTSSIRALPLLLFAAMVGVSQTTQGLI